MTYKEWIRSEHPQVKVLTEGGITTAGIMYRMYVERVTGMDPVEYHHMGNDKGFADWLKGVWSQLKDTGMKATNRNKVILWHIYKKKVKARLVKFIDDEGFMRDIEQPREIYYDEATKIDPEVLDDVQDRIRSTWLHPQGTLQEHDPKRFEKAIEEFDPIKHWEEIKKAVEQIRSQFDPITPNHYGGKDDPYEAIKVINAWGLGFCLGNVLKYIKRTGKKGDPVEDLKKAKRYLELEIEKYDIHG